MPSKSHPDEKTETRGIKKNARPSVQSVNICPFSDKKALFASQTSCQAFLGVIIEQYSGDDNILVLGLSNHVLWANNKDQKCLQPSRR